MTSLRSTRATCLPIWRRESTRVAGGAGANDDQVEGRHAEGNCPLTLPELSTLIHGIRPLATRCQV
jgi:hypothetical protein